MMMGQHVELKNIGANMQKQLILPKISCFCIQKIMGCRLNHSCCSQSRTSGEKLGIINDWMCQFDKLLHKRADKMLASDRFFESQISTQKQQTVYWQTKPRNDATPTYNQVGEDSMLKCIACKKLQLSMVYP
jgi:hypothetical protein